MNTTVSKTKRKLKSSVYGNPIPNSEIKRNAKMLLIKRTWIEVNLIKVIKYFTDSTKSCVKYTIVL